MISSAIQRSILRWIHIIFAIPIIGYIYSPFDQIPDYAPVVYRRPCNRPHGSLHVEGTPRINVKNTGEDRSSPTGR